MAPTHPRVASLAPAGQFTSSQSPKDSACQIGASFSPRDCHGASPLAMTWDFFICRTNDSPFYRTDHGTGSVLLRPDVPLLLPDSMIFLLKNFFAHKLFHFNSDFD